MLRPVRYAACSVSLDIVGKAVLPQKALDVMPRFHSGELYDSRLVDDLRRALVSTGLYATVGVADHDTGEVSQIKCRRVPVIDDGPVLQAISTLLRVADRRARLLGLDAPAKVEQSGGIESTVTVRVITLVPSPPDVGS